MSMEYTGIPYFPMTANFFEDDTLELLEAKFGIRASYIVVRLLCKIYKDGYFISWGKEQSAIFLRKMGGEVNEETMSGIIDLLLDKGFFNKEAFEQHSILTSEHIQKIWLEATIRRKRDFSKLPYLLTPTPESGKQKGELNKENASNSPIQGELNLENEDNFVQTKQNKTKAYKEEVEIGYASFEIPAYARNQATHNINGLIESLEHHKVTDPKDKQAILRLSDYGRKDTPVWKLLLNTNWSKIGVPGKYIIASLTGGKKRNE